MPLRRVADLPVPLQERAAERELAPFPGGEGRRVPFAAIFLGRVL